MNTLARYLKSAKPRSRLGTGWDQASASASAACIALGPPASATAARQRGCSASWPVAGVPQLSRVQRQRRRQPCRVRCASVVRVRMRVSTVSASGGGKVAGAGVCGGGEGLETQIVGPVMPEAPAARGKNMPMRVSKWHRTTSSRAALSSLTPCSQRLHSPQNSRDICRDISAVPAPAFSTAH